MSSDVGKMYWTYSYASALTFFQSHTEHRVPRWRSRMELCLATFFQEFPIFLNWDLSFKLIKTSVFPVLRWYKSPRGSTSISSIFPMGRIREIEMRV